MAKPPTQPTGEPHEDNKPSLPQRRGIGETPTPRPGPKDIEQLRQPRRQESPYQNPYNTKRGGDYGSDQPGHYGGQYGSDTPGHYGSDVADSDQRVDIDQNKSPYDQPGNVPQDKDNDSGPWETHVDKPAAPGREELAGKESTAADKKSDATGKAEENKVGRGYRQTADKSGRYIEDGSKQKMGVRQWYFSRRRVILGGGGIVGTIIALVFGFSVIQGPLQFIHMFQLLRGFHMGANDNSADSRFFNFYRYIKAGGDYRVTRVGAVGQRIATNLEADMVASGIKPTYSGPLRLNDGFVIDRESQKSPFRGMSDEEVKQKFSNAGFNDVIEKGPNGELLVKNDKLGVYKTYKLGKFAVKSAGKSGLSSFVGFRSFAKYAGIDLHPIRILDRKANPKLIDLYNSLRKKTADSIQSGENKTGVGANPQPEPDCKPDDKGCLAKKAQIEEQNALAKQAADVGQETANGGDATLAAEKNGDTSAFEKFKGSTAKKLAGGAGAVGIVCIVKDINDNAYKIRYIHVILPLARVGAQVGAIGSEVMGGPKDLDTEQLGFYKQRLYDAQGKSWLQATPIQTNLGNSQTGAQTEKNDVNKEVKDAFSPDKPFDQFLAPIPYLQEVCGPTGTILLGIVSLGLGIASGGLFSVAANAIGGIILSSVIVEKISHWLAHDNLNLNAVGPLFGAYADWGFRLMANGDMVGAGGRPLSQSEADQANNAAAYDDHQQFMSKSLAHRLFSPYDAHSALSQFMDKNVSPSPMQNFSKMGLGIFGLVHSLASLPNLISSTAHALPATTSYKYPFPQIGFSEDELQDTNTENPYTNSNNAAALVAGNDTYKTRAKKCFGADIAQENGVWVVHHSNPEIGLNPYSPDYAKNNCGENSGAWRSIRLWIYDDNISLTADCWYGNQPSCTELGFSGAAISDTVTDNQTQNISIGDLTKAILNFQSND